jgi:hypothetical protein
VRNDIKAALEKKKTANHEIEVKLPFTAAYVIFREFDGKKRKGDDILSSADRVFINLLVGAGEIAKTKNPELSFYMRESHCFQETIRLLRKYETETNVDIDLITKHFTPRPNRRFCEILIFISQFFGRAECVMGDSQVKQLWSTLLFVKDFIKAVENQCTRNQERYVDDDKEEQPAFLSELENSDDEETEAKQPAKTTKRKAIAKPAENANEKRKPVANSARVKEATGNAAVASVVSKENIMCFCLPLFDADGIPFLYTMFE